MVRLIETQMQGEGHLMINLAMIKHFASGQDFVYVGERSQISALNRRIAIKNRNYIKVQHFAKKWQLPFYVIYHFFIILKQLIASRSEDKIVFTSLFPVTHFLVKRFFFLSSAEKYIVLHGELKQIEVYSNALLKVLGKFLKQALLHKVQHLKYVVLGENIKETVVSKNWLQPEEMVCVEHPYDFKDVLEKVKDPQHIRLAVLGSASFNKGTHHFIELARENRNPKLRFEIIGALADPKLEPLLHDQIKYFKERFVSSSDYNLALSRTDAAAFFLDEKEYAYTASAAFLDAVKYKIPVLAVTNSYFRNYFKKYGDVGLLFDDYISLKEFLLNRDLESLIAEKNEIWQSNFEKIIAQNSI
ncbi:hypothetical protein [Chryseobacterium sp. MDT2-18]|uniref:hypothetical protein n=1 Tax=Chryseobacterium sp. MDT2-18 TaxID=1259136 RepID=UPI002780671D|nr:hypothetical protein [Chryseobacterium sp. MDT2-18]MDQ0476844.1 hypothetical protein [Chryseobacterium sp. MDT2-18]